MKTRHERVKCLTNKHENYVKISRAHINTKVVWLFTCYPSTCEVEMKDPQAKLAGLTSRVCELQIQVLDQASKHQAESDHGRQLILTSDFCTHVDTHKKTILILFISTHNFLK